MYSVSLILVSTTVMLHEYFSFIPGSNTPKLHKCNKCAHVVSCGHDETFMLSVDSVRAFKSVASALIHALWMLSTLTGRD